MIERKVEEVPYPDHPDRCQAMDGNQNQCINLAVEGCKNCIAHGANIQQKKNEEKRSGLYQLMKFQARYEDMLKDRKDEPILGLRNEIAILRMKLEGVLNQCENAGDLLTHSQKINNTIQLIGKLVYDAKKLEASLGHLIDRTTLMALCDQLVTIVAKEVTDPDALNRIGNEFTSALDAAVAQRATLTDDEEKKRKS